MKALDLTNQKFGRLTAIQKAPKRNDKYTRWLCECECGNKIEVRTDYLRNGHTKSCGCEKALHFSRKIKEGEKYGKLTVKKYCEGHLLYQCECECGNIVFVKGYNLINGNTQSCGCLKSKGELVITKLLQEMNINFKTQYYFQDCRFPDSNRVAYFDYAIFKNEKLIGLIEYDGQQHFTGWGQNEESLSKIKARDKYKECYCILKNIPLIRIPYSDYNKLNSDYMNKIIMKLEEAEEGL